MPIAHNQQAPQVQQSKAKSAKALQLEKEQQDKDNQFLVGIQAQNLYLMNYINKLEYLLQSQTKGRKRDKKKRQKQLSKVLKAVCNKPNICNDTSSLQYYLGVTFGVEDGEVKAAQSEEEDLVSEDEKEKLTERLFRGKKEFQEKPDSLIQLLTPFQNTSVQKQGSDVDSNGVFKSEKDLALDFKKKENQILEKYEQSKENVDYIRKIENIRDKIKGDKSKIKDEKDDDSKEIQTFLEREWQSQARVASELIGNYRE